MVTIVPSLYTGKGLLSDDNQIFDNFAGGLLRGFTINPTPVAGQYFTTIGGGAPDVTDGMEDDEGMSEEDFARLMEQYRNQQNLLNEGGAQDDFDFAPPEAEPPSMQVSSLSEALGNMYSGFYDDDLNFQGGFKDLIADMPIGRLAREIRGLLTGSSDDSSDGLFDDPDFYSDLAEDDVSLED